jgi:nucleosome binding factor SPN SPT16 subunit
VVQEQGQGHLVGKLPKNLGFGMGLEFRESCNILSSSNTTPVQAGMILNVTVGRTQPLVVLLAMIEHRWCTLK